MSESGTGMDESDVFISHAGPEKKTLAYPLRAELEKLGLRCFLDEKSLEISKTTNAEQIKAALWGCKMGLFVLSPSFVAQKCPRLELGVFLDRYDRANVDGTEGLYCCHCSTN